MNAKRESKQRREGIHSRKRVREAVARGDQDLMAWGFEGAYESKRPSPVKRANASSSSSTEAAEPMDEDEEPRLRELTRSELERRIRPRFTGLAHVSDELNTRARGDNLIRVLCESIKARSTVVDGPVYPPVPKETTMRLASFSAVTTRLSSFLSKFLDRCCVVDQMGRALSV